MDRLINYLKTNLLKPIKASFSRFPEVFFELLVLAIVLVIDNRTNNYQPEHFRLFNALRVGLFTAVIYHAAAILAVEKYKLKLTTRILIGAGVVLFAAGYGLYNYFTFQDQFNFFLTFYTTTIFTLGIISFVSVPYFYKRNNYTIYIPYLLTRLLLTIFYTGALILGTIGVIGLSDFLFQLSINNKLYGDIAIVFSTLIGGPLFLGFVPLVSKNLTIKDFGFVWKVLLNRIIIPLSTAATLIIFAYATLGRLTGVYQGDIFLVSAFSSLSVVLIAIVLTEEFEKEVNYVSWFRKYLPYPMLLLVLNLGVEVTIEILNEGMTVSNYLTALFTDFFAGAYLLILIKQLYQPILIPLILSGSLLVASFTPFLGIRDWSYRATLNQLTNTLQEFGMLENNTIIPRQDLTPTQREKLSNALYEISNIFSFEDIDYLPPNFDLSKVEQVFGFNLYSDDFRTNLYIGANTNSGLEISGYDIYYTFYVYRNEPVSVGKYEVGILDNSILINEGSTRIASLNLSDKLKLLYDNYGSSKYEVPVEELTLLFDNPKFKLVISNLSASVRQGETFSLDSLNGILLIKD